MSDISNPTTPITVYCGENPLESAAITKTVDGSKNRMDVNSTITIAGTAINAEIKWEGNNAPYKANMWLPVASYTVPAGYDFLPYIVQYQAGNSSSLIRVGDNLIMGSLNTTTNVFTDASAYTSPRFAAYIELRLTEDVSSNRTITVTYVNQDGVAGRTATMTLIGSGGSTDKTGYTYIFTLQGTDTGVRDITNISTSATGAGNFTIVGINDIIRDSADASGVVYTNNVEIGAYLVRSGGTVGLSVTSASTAPVQRYLSATGQLQAV